jgi:hypothetical protein
VPLAASRHAGRGIRSTAVIALWLLAASGGRHAAAAQEASTPGANGAGMAGMSGDTAMAAVSPAMGGPLMETPHMRMTALGPAAAGDSARAARILEALRAGLAPYADYHRALADGYRIFAPKVPQRVYHFTSWRRALVATFHFDPAAPSSLLYERTGDTTYRLVGAMYTARRGAPLADLDARVPLSVGQWHVHTNWCLPRRGGRARLGDRGPDGRPLFGGQGTITTAAACQAADGRFIPQAFGWMLHVYPYATASSAIWGRDAMHEMAGDHDGAGMSGMPGMGTH